MLTEPTLDKLKQMRLPSMARVIRDWKGSVPDGLTPLEAVSLLVDSEWNDRESRRFERRIKEAKLVRGAEAEDIRWSTARGLDKGATRALFECAWVHHRQNILLLGATGVGKTFFASALTRCAIRLGHRALIVRTSRLLNELEVARATGTYRQELGKLARIPVLVLDDFLVSSMSSVEARDLLEVMEDRFANACTIFCSQVPSESWHAALGEPAVADAICDRVIHRAHKIHLKGPSMRKEIQNT